MADVKEDVVDTGDVIKGQKTGYLKKRAISPIHESLNAYKDIVSINENLELTYDSLSKVASLYQLDDAAPIKQMRVTNTDWELFHEEVVAQMMEGLINEDN